MRDQGEVEDDETSRGSRNELLDNPDVAPMVRFVNSLLSPAIKQSRTFTLNHSKVIYRFV